MIASPDLQSAFISFPAGYLANFTAVADAQRYELEYSDDGQSYALAATRLAANPQPLSYLVQYSPAFDGGGRNFRVKAFDVSNNSATSNVRFTAGTAVVGA